jgi:hypothetical protein
MSAVQSFDPSPLSPRLSKSRFCSGLQCHKRLWLEAREPDALELQPDSWQRFRVNQGLAVGARARALFPGGVLVDLPHGSPSEKIATTARAIADRSSAVFEGDFRADGVSCTVDILERTQRGHVLIEVKSATSVKEEYIPDIALQVWLARRCGVEIERAEVMHLNRECRFPDLSDLFVREDVSLQVEHVLPQVPALVAQQLAMLAGSEPVVPIGPHCREPRDCPFEGRCWQDVPIDHVTRLHGLRRTKAWELVRGWRERVGDLPPDQPLTPIQERQRRALLEGRTILEPGLGEVLRALIPPIAHLDFETVASAIPVWPGLGPWQAAPAQFSCHVESGNGPLSLIHREWLAVGPDDPRPQLARALLDACRGANTVTSYTGFERAMIRQLAQAVPDLSTDLSELESRLVDLAAIVSSYVYAPGFGGSFGLKQVLPVLAPGFSYDNLPINDGSQASAELHRLLFESAALLPTERASLEMELRAYCEMDTLAMVKLTERLRILAT